MKNAIIIPGYRTDHSAILFTFSACLEKQGKCSWTFNSQLLRDADHIQRIKSCFNDTTLKYYLSGDMEDLLSVELSCNDQTFFELLKMKIRSLSIHYSINKSKEEKYVTLKLENDIVNLESIMNHSLNDEVQKSLFEKKNLNWKIVDKRKFKACCLDPVLTGLRMVKSVQIIFVY
ncbi:unnamed protein product [Mytilus coruscus]|uniref:Uncharacterized protein n=1 Tax=Mytilus coruscus TaxID=42192 RepID=A0A6J8AVD6_MYTCO|nr:unnamed protein product [Mytilus coruscus]